MGVRALTCFELACDGCGEVMVDDNGEVLVGFDTPDGLQLDARADMGWTTDGRGSWHCPTCPELLFDDGSRVLPGQLLLGREHSEDQP